VSVKCFAVQSDGLLLRAPNFVIKPAPSALTSAFGFLVTGDSLVGAGAGNCGSARGLRNSERALPRKDRALLPSIAPPGAVGLLAPCDDGMLLTRRLVWTVRVGTCGLPLISASRLRSTGQSASLESEGDDTLAALDLTRPEALESIGRQEALGCIAMHDACACSRCRRGARCSLGSGYCTLLKAVYSVANRSPPASAHASFEEIQCPPSLRDLLRRTLFVRSRSRSPPRMLSMKTRFSPCHDARTTIRPRGARVCACKYQCNRMMPGCSPWPALSSPH